MSNLNNDSTETLVVTKRKPGRPKKIQSVDSTGVQTNEVRQRKPVSKFVLAERAVKKYNKLVGKQQEAVEQAVTRVKEKFVQKKSEFLDSLSSEVRLLVEAELHGSVQNPDVSESDHNNDEADESVEVVAAE